MRRPYIPNPFKSEPDPDDPAERSSSHDEAALPGSVSKTWSPETPLLQLGPEQSLTIGHAFEGSAILGQTGSGKSSGPLLAFMLAFMRAMFGGLILTTKPGDADEVRRIAKLAGREHDLRIVAPDGRWKLNILDYTYRAGGVRGGGLSENVVNLVLDFLQARDRSRGQPSDPFWLESTKILLTCAIDLLALAGEPISFANIARVIESAANSADEVRDAEWQAKSYLNNLVSRAVDIVNRSAAQKIDLEVAIEYWLGAYARLDPKTRSGIVATAKSLTFPFERSLFSTLFGGDSNCLPEDCFRKGAIVVLDVPGKVFGDAGVAAQILFKMVWQRAIERRNVATDPRPVFLITDEYQTYVTSYDSLFQATARSSRCATVVLTQNLDSIVSRLPSATGRAEAEALLGNFNFKIFCSQDHVGTNEWAAKMIGERWITSQNVSTSLGGAGNMTAGTSDQRRFLVEPMTFMQLLKGGKDNDGLVQAVCFRSGRPFSNGQNHTLVNFDQNLS